MEEIKSIIEELFFCKVCLAEVKEELVWIRGDSYCEDCVDNSVELTNKLKESEKEILCRILMELGNDEEGKKEFMDTFTDYFGGTQIPTQIIKQELVEVS